MLHRRQFLCIFCAVPLGFLACERKSKHQGLSVGQLMPTFELPAFNNGPATISPGHGPYLLNFWATWCPPCRAEMGGLDRVHATFAPKGLKVLGISVDDDRFLVQEFVLKEKLSFPIFIDGNGQDAVRKLLQISVYPTSFLVNKAGHIAEIMVGEQNWDSVSLRQRLEKVVG